MNKNIQPLSRLCGLETEHAMHCDQSFAIPFLPGKREHSHEQHYEAIMEVLKEQHPSAPPVADKKGAFFANGSAFWFEGMPGANRGLFEACTPECNSPKSLLASSRAIDAQLLDATENLSSQQVKLIKNCHDTRNNIYGAQENYEIQSFDSSDADQWKWKIKCLKAITAVNIYFLNACFFVLLMVLYNLWPVLGASGTVACLLLPWFILCLCKRKWVDGGEVLSVFLGTVLMPKTLAVSLFYRSTKIGKTYRQLTPFLVSRVIFAGAGHLDKKGKFHIGQKASSRTADSILFHVGAQQSIFCINDIFKDLARWAFKKKTDFDTGRRRLSLAIGDSNMCEEAEYLKIATTSLVLDAIESGAFSEIPKLRGTIACLRKLNRDPSLKATVGTSRGQMSAIEIQQFYLNVCRRYVESLESPPTEALEILQRWNDVLMKLATDPEELFGRIDWITKRALMRRVHRSGSNGDRENTHAEFYRAGQLKALMKINTKYHEVSNEGYYYQLRNNGMTDPVLDDQDVTVAGRMPPLSSTAAQRSRYIREFGDEIEWISWDTVKLYNSDELIEFSRS